MCTTPRIRPPRNLRQMGELKGVLRRLSQWKVTSKAVGEQLDKFNFGRELPSLVLLDPCPTERVSTFDGRSRACSVLVAVFSDNCLESIDPRSPVREDSLGEIVERTGYLIRFHFFIRDRREMPVELQFCRAEIARCNVPANDVGSKNAEPFLSEREQPIR